MKKLILGTQLIATGAGFVWVPEQYGWQCGDIIYVDSEKQMRVVNYGGQIGPIAFKLLFTAPERIKADELKTTDPYIKDFWSLLDDPRTDIVDMSLTSVQMAIRHTLEQVAAAGVPVDVDVRFEQIMAWGEA